MSGAEDVAVITAFVKDASGRPVPLSMRSKAILAAARLLLRTVAELYSDFYQARWWTRLRWLLQGAVIAWVVRSGARAYIDRRWSSDQRKAMVPRTMSSVSLGADMDDEDSETDSLSTEHSSPKKGLGHKRIGSDCSMEPTRFGLATDDSRLSLAQCTAFAGVADEPMQFFVESADIKSFGPGEVVFEEGDECASFLIVHSGELYLTTKAGGEEDDSGAIGHGHVVAPGKVAEGLLFVLASIGDDAPVSCRYRSCTARAGHAGAVVVSLPTSALDEAFTVFPKAMRLLAQHLCARFSFVVLSTLARYFGLQSELVVPPRDTLADVACPTDIFSRVLGCSSDANDDVRGMLSMATLLDRQAGEYTTPPNTRASHLLVLLDGELYVEFEAHGKNDAPCSPGREKPNFFRKGRKSSLGLEVHVDGKPLPLGCIIGELPILVDRALPLLYRCGTRCRFAALPRDVVQRLLELRPRDCCLRLLQITADKTPLWLHRVDAFLDWVPVQGGRTLFRQGDPTRGFYVVLSGRLVSLAKRKCAACVKALGAGHAHASMACTCPEWDTVDHLERGRLCGEVDCLQDCEVRSETVRASRDTEVCQISPNLLQLLALEFPKSILHFSSNMARRTNIVDEAKRSVSTIAVVPSDASVRIHEVCAELTAALKLMGKAVHVSPDSDLSGGAAKSLDGLRLARSLAELEDRSRWLVYEAEPTVTPWTRRCVRQADLILVVVRFDGSQRGDAAPSAVERYVEEATRNGMNVDRHLLLLHDPLAADVTQTHTRLIRNSSQGALPPRTATSLHLNPRIPYEASDTLQPGLRGFIAHHLGTSLFGAGSNQLRFTRHYLSQRPWARRWHHIRIGESADWARCARLLVGQGIGICLGGGGARGNIHFGVIRAMEELGIPIDAVSGCSFGALAGAIYCMTAAEPGSMMQVVERTMGRSFSKRGMLLDINYPYVAAFTGRFLNTVLQRTFARRRCEDMLVPFLCTTTDIANFEGKTHGEGPIWRIVRASMSLVGFVPPLPHHEHDSTGLLVDGGYTNQYPTDELRQIGAGTVICIKACPDFESVSTDYGDSVRGGAVALVQKLGIKWRWYKGADPPSQAEIQERLKFLPDEIRGKSKDLVGWDLFITPPIDDFGLLEFAKFRELEQTGYEAAFPALKEWLAKKAEEDDNIINTIVNGVAASGIESEVASRPLRKPGAAMPMRQVMSMPHSLLAASR